LAIREPSGAGHVNRSQVSIDVGCHLLVVVQGVEAASPDDPNGGWAYTVGATESCGIPELVVTDTD
jgi:hypothetical protein